MGMVSGRIPWLRSRRWWCTSVRVCSSRWTTPWACSTPTRWRASSAASRPASSRTCHCSHSSCPCPTPGAPSTATACMQFVRQVGSALFIISWNVVATTLVCLVVPLRMPDDELANDDAVHGEEAYALCGATARSTTPPSTAAGTPTTRCSSATRRPVASRRTSDDRRS
jgi:hypothetical protein